MDISLWRGRAHDIIEEEIRTQNSHSASDYRRVKVEKVKTYASLVKTNYQPIVDPEKFKQSSERLSMLIQPRNIIKKMLLNKEIE